MCDLLESPACATEEQSGIKYVSLSLTTKTFEKMIRLCNLTAVQDDVDLKLIDDAMGAKL